MGQHRKCSTNRYWDWTVPYAKSKSFEQPRSIKILIYQYMEKMASSPSTCNVDSFNSIQKFFFCLSRESALDLTL